MADFMMWNPDFETGIEIVDEQHRGLLDRVNRIAPVLAPEPSASLTHALEDSDV